MNKPKDFFWINKRNCIAVQKHLQDQGIKLHTGEGIINWHEGFSCIVVFADDGRGHNYYQKVPFYHPDYGYEIINEKGELS